MEGKEEEITNQKNTKEKKVIKIHTKNTCVNHEEKRATRTCEICDKQYCNDCIIEYWSHNFLSYAYLGEKKDFVKSWLCKECSKKKRRKGVATAIFVLITVIILPTLVIIMNS